MTKSWFADFALGRGGLRYRKTGAVIPLNRETLEEGRQWLEYFFAVKFAAPKANVFKVAFSADAPRPWYLLWPVLKMAGARLSAPERADVIVRFDDSTHTPPARKDSAVPHVNAHCLSIAKSAVETAFANTFGYALAVDPQKHQGQAVEKSEVNGAHDGHIVQCPRAPRPGFSYQRVIDNRIALDAVEDLRTVVVGGRPIVTFRKQRSFLQRFANHNNRVLLAYPSDLFSSAEIQAIGQFCALLGMDWGGLDILRDRRTKQIYIVDANKTDMGPPLALPLADKMRATRLLASALRRYVWVARNQTAGRTVKTLTGL
jgi:hypothetical protein